MRFSNEEQQSLQLTVARLCIHRTQRRDLSEDEIASELGFEEGKDDAPARRMYERLKNAGLPDWLVYPEAPSDADEPGHTVAAAEEPAAERKVRTTGKEAIPLPPAERAADMFRRQLRPERVLGDPHWWQGTLEEDIENLYRLREWLCGEQFVSVLYHEEDREIYRKDELPNEVWKSLCEAEGLDPESSSAVEGPTIPSPLGASPRPWPGWVPLMTLYALRNPSVKPLIEALHPDPASVNVEKLYQKRDIDGAKRDGTVTELKNAAERLAKVVRGGKVRRGAPPAEDSYYDLWVKRNLIDPLRRKGYTAEEIFEELKAQGYPTKPSPSAEGPAFTVEEIRRLAGLDFSPTDEVW